MGSDHAGVPVGSPGVRRRLQLGRIVRIFPFEGNPGKLPDVSDPTVLKMLTVPEQSRILGEGVTTVTSGKEFPPDRQQVLPSLDPSRIRQTQTRPNRAARRAAARANKRKPRCRATLRALIGVQPPALRHSLEVARNRRIGVPHRYLRHLPAIPGPVGEIAPQPVLRSHWGCETPRGYGAMTEAIVVDRTSRAERRFSWRSLVLAIGVIAAFIATPSVVAAEPSESQHLRGLGDRVFQVHVVGWAYEPVNFQRVEFEFDTCLVFQSDGTYINPAFPDPAFPIPGTWTQQSVGASTPFTSTIEFDVGGGFVLTSNEAGEVRPGPRRRLEYGRGHGVNAHLQRCSAPRFRPVGRVRCGRV